MPAVLAVRFRAGRADAGAAAAARATAAASMTLSDIPFLLSHGRGLGGVSEGSPRGSGVLVQIGCSNTARDFYRSTKPLTRPLRDLSRFVTVG